jgi:hypothetical protein
MGDEEKQAKPQFEPPPWEREAFEALAARRAERDEAARVAAEALAGAAGGGVVVGGEAAADPAVAVAPAPELAVEAPQRQGGSGLPEEDSKLVQAMLLQLRQEERSDGRAARLIAWVASAVTAVLGVSMLIAGLGIVRNSGGKSAAVIGSAVLSLFGLVFIGMAAWVWISTSRVRGR